MTNKTDIIRKWKAYAESQPDGAKEFLKQSRNNFFAIFNKAKNDMIAANYKNDANIGTPDDMCNIMKNSTDEQLLNLLVELSLKKVDPKSQLSPSAGIKYGRKNIVGKGIGGPAYEYVAMAVHVTGDHGADGDAAQEECVGGSETSNEGTREQSTSALQSFLSMWETSFLRACCYRQKNDHSGGVNPKESEIQPSKKSGPLELKSVEMGVHVDYDGKNQQHRFITRFWPFNIVSWLQLPNAHDFPRPTPYIARALHCAAKLAFGENSERVKVDTNHFEEMRALLTKTGCFRTAIKRSFGDMCWSMTPKWENYCRETELDLAHPYRILENPVKSDSGIRIEGPPQDDPEQWGQ